MSSSTDPPSLTDKALFEILKKKFGNLRMMRQGGAYQIYFNTRGNPCEAMRIVANTAEELLKKAMAHVDPPPDPPPRGDFRIDDLEAAAEKFGRDAGRKVADRTPNPTQRAAARDILSARMRAAMDREAVKAGRKKNPRR